ncbi:hypothetical protein JT359_00535 [Candidatus Poribacteria bacterium]|nr:hypothetical protein [Candidatus Poribacteria bacterium]
MTEPRNSHHPIGINQCFKNVFNFYTMHFSAFWRVMIPVIILSILLDSIILYYFYNHLPNTTWTVETSDGLTVMSEGRIGNLNWSVTFGSTILLFLWFTICPLILSVSELCRGRDIYAKDIWQRTFHKAKSIIGASLFLLIVVILVVLCLIFIMLLFLNSGAQFHTIPIILMFISIGVYLTVKCSLFNQVIILENQTAINSFRRSSHLVYGRWGAVFGRYFLLLWGSSVFISLTFGLTYSILTLVDPQFIPIRDKLLSGRILTLLLGIDFWASYNNMRIAFGNISAVLNDIPTYSVILGLFIMKTILYGFFAPIWAILKTHLYFEQTGDVSENALIQ